MGWRMYSLDILTKSQKNILIYLVSGFSNKEIARKLDIAETTVKAHLKCICQKWEMNNRTQIAVTAYNLGVRPLK